MSRSMRLGIFVVATLLILVVGVFIIGSKQYLFSSTYQLQTRFDNVAGLNAGADVRLGGVHSGTVRTVLLPHRPGEKITVIMDLDKSTHEIVKQDSVASIETEGLLGNQYLAISFGSVGKADVRDGDIIAGQPPFEMSGLLKKTSGILDSSQQAIENTSAAAANLQSITSKIDRGQGTAGALVNDRQLYSNLEQTTSAMRSTMLQAQAGVTSFQENMEALKHNFFLRGYFNKRGYADSNELAENAVERLPQGTPVKTFTYSAKQLFDQRDTAKLKNQKLLKDSGEFLAGNQFGIAVVVASAGVTGDTQKALVLTEARAMVVRGYLVENFGFDDSQLKTLGRGKQEDINSDIGWGAIEILIYPVGTKTPPSKQAEEGVSPKTASDQSVQVPASSTSKP